MSHVRTVSVLGIVISVCFGVLATGPVVPFDAERWDLSQATVAEHLGRQALSGRAVLAGEVLEDGVITVDVAVSGERSYPGLMFRINGRESHESVYVRPHITGVFGNAAQYAPVFYGTGCWQLYHGPGLTAGVELPPNEWVTLRLELKGKRARLFVGDDPKPVLNIPSLATGVSAGGIGLSGPRNASAFFSNFRYEKRTELPDWPMPAAYPPPGVLRNWQVSPALSLAEVDLEAPPASQLPADARWTSVEAEASGLVNLSRLVPRRQRGPALVAARTTLHAETAQTLKLGFGYSDAIALFLDGRPVFSGDRSYRKRGVMFQGVVTTDDVVHLTLEPGEHELSFWIVESFGGWGFVFRDADATYEHPELTRTHRSGKDFFSPESVLYDAQRQRYYVSEYDYFDRGAASGGGRISILGPGLELATAGWVKGLNHPTGMAIVDGQLYVVERTGLAVIDIESAEIVERIAIEGAVFPNDIALGPEGELYVSDSSRGAVFRGKDGAWELWLSAAEIGYPNAIWAAGNEFVVGDCLGYRLLSVDIPTKAITEVAPLPKGVVDGLRLDEHGNYLVSHFEGRVYRIARDGQSELLLDLSADMNNTCDFEYRPEERLLIIPALTGDRVAAYRFAADAKVPSGP